MYHVDPPLMKNTKPPARCSACHERFSLHGQANSSKPDLLQEQIALTKTALKSTEKEIETLKAQLQYKIHHMNTLKVDIYNLEYEMRQESSHTKQTCSLIVFHGDEHEELIQRELTLIPSTLIAQISEVVPFTKWRTLECYFGSDCVFTHNGNDAFTLQTDESFLIKTITKYGGPVCFCLHTH
jgi:hypothetical protein